MKKIINSIAWMIFILFFIGFCVSIYIDSKEIAPPPHQSKQIELSQNFISGYKDGKVSWQINATYIWAGRSRYLYQAEKIKSGLIMNKAGRVIIDNIEANGIKVNTRSKTFRTNNGLTAIFNRQIEDEDGKKSIKPIYIKATRLNYYQLSNRTVIQDNIQLKQEDVVIEPEGMVVVDHDLDVVKIDDGVLINSDEFSVSANRMTLYLNDDYSELEGGISGIRFAKDDFDEDLDDRETELRAKETKFRCKKLIYKNKENRDEIDLIGNVVIKQDDKSISGNKATYRMKDDIYIIEGKVNLKAESLRWIIDKHKKSAFENELAQESIDKALNISADKMIFNAKTRYFKMFGDVEIKQEDKMIRAKKLDFDDNEGTLTLLGNVSIDYDDADSIETEFIEVNIESESVFAGKGVETEFDIELRPED